MKAIVKGAAVTILMTTTAWPMLAQDDAGESVADFVPVTDEMLANPDDGDWLMWRRTLNHWGYSPLDQLTPETVGDLELVWSRGMGPGNQESTPLVYDGVMYLPNPRDIIQAIDAATGDLIWEYRRQLPADLADYVNLNDITRALSIYDDKIIHMTGDGFIVALNAQTGAVEWETQITDYQGGNYQTSGAIIANGKALSGRTCKPDGGPETCFIAAHDLETGEELWRTYLIPRPGEDGDETWGGIPYESRWHVGSWITPSYDPELNLAYFGTSVTHPYSKFMLGLATPEEQDQDFLYQTSTLAVNPDTGEIIWYQQHIRDQWDLDHPFERILVDTAIAPNPDEVPWINPNVTPGEEYRVLTGIPGKTGIFYSIDRETGEFLWARETVEQNVVTDIDTATGRATMNYDVFYTEAGQTNFVCPSLAGGKDWLAGAYSPLTNTIYYPLQNLCMNATILGDEVIFEDQGLDASVVAATGTDQIGTVRGINVETGEELWLHEQRAATGSLLTTGGGLLFGGDTNGRFRAYDQENGDVLWEVNLGSPIGGFPISYEVDGEQYIAIPVGNYLIAGVQLGATPEIRPTTTTNNIFVFKLAAD